MVISSAATIGGIAAQECVRLLHDLEHGDVSRAGVHLSFDGDAGSLFGWLSQKREECPGHRLELGLMDIVDLSLPRESLVEDARRTLAQAMLGDAVELFNDKELVYSQVCNSCGHEEQGSPTLLGAFSRTACTCCGDVATAPKDRSEDLRDRYTFQQLGIPSNHLVRVVIARSGEVSEAWLPVR